MNKKSESLKEVILHIGLHKTGTSSIQQSLFSDDNKKYLKKLDFNYPKCWPLNHSVPIYSAFCEEPEKYHINIKMGYNSEDIKKVNDSNLQLLTEEVAKSSQSNLVISGEDISLLTCQNLFELKNFIKSMSKHDISIRVITYVRDPISWAVSNMQQSIKAGNAYKDSFFKIENALENLYRNRIEKFITVFGRDAIELYTFEEASKSELGPAGHFLSVLGFDDNEIHNFSLERSNESISQLAGNILSYINYKSPLIVNGEINEDRFVGDFEPLKSIKGAKFDIPFSDKKQLLNNCQGDINWLNHNFGIDYSNVNLLKIEPIEFNEGTIDEIRLVFPRLSKTLRQLVYRYLCEHIEKNKVSDNLDLKNLVSELYIIDQDLMKYDRAEDRFKEMLGIKNTINPSLLYRELALFMECYDQIESAEILMEKALEIYPNGPFIKEKLNQYKRRNQSNY